MRRIDVIAIGLGVFTAGGAIYLALKLAGLDSLNAGIWSQVVMVGGLVGWLATSLLRVVTQSMTLNRQLDDYEEALLQKRLDELTPEQVAALQQELESESSPGSS